MRILWCIFLLIFIVACSMPTRGGYDRASGRYVKKETPKKSHKTKQRSQEVSQEVSQKSHSTQTNEDKTQEKTTTQSDGSVWENAAKPWIGTPYRYGGSSKSGVDCSGFVMQIYKEVRGMYLPHKASKMYDMGKSVSRSDLREGDLVFFGSFWEIDHVGIYLSGDRFVHASSSKGVMISPMDNVYWEKRYQGARRY